MWYLLNNKKPTGDGGPATRRTWKEYGGTLDHPIDEHRLEPLDYHLAYLAKVGHKPLFLRVKGMGTHPVYVFYHEESGYPEDM